VLVAALRWCGSDEDVLDCQRCRARLAPIAVLARYNVVDRISRHLPLPLGPTALGHPKTIAYHVTGERLGLRGPPRA